jgi:hypothetical protein
MITLLMTVFSAAALAAGDGNSSQTVDELVSNQLPTEVGERFYQEMSGNGIDQDSLKTVKVEQDPAHGKILVTGVKGQHTVDNLVFIGTQLALFIPYSVNGTWAISRDGKPWIDTDLSWEFSQQLQYYSAGGAYHLKGWPLFAGARVGLLQLNPPWSRGFDSEFDNQFAVEPELGARGWMLNRHLMASFSASALWIPSSTFEMPVVYRIKVGIAYEILKKH